MNTSHGNLVPRAFPTFNGKALGTRLKSWLTKLQYDFKRVDWARIFCPHWSCQTTWRIQRDCVVLPCWIIGTENSQKILRPRNSLPSLLFQWKQLYLRIRVIFRTIWLLISNLYLFRFIFKLKNGTELSKKICVLPDTNLHSQWHDSSVVLGECFLSTVPIKY